MLKRMILMLVTVAVFLGAVGFVKFRQIQTAIANAAATLTNATQVLAASIRHPVHVLEAALAGAHVATIPAKVIDQMFKHPLTDAGIAAFLKDWQKVQ